MLIFFINDQLLPDDAGMCANLLFSFHLHLHQNEHNLSQTVFIGEAELNTFWKCNIYTLNYHVFTLSEKNFLLQMAGLYSQNKTHQH